jgi:hypothetical protein
VSPQDFHGEIVEFPAGKQSALEEMERRWNARVLLFAKRRLMLAQESGAKGPEVKRRNTEEFHDALRREFAAWKATRECRSGPTEFYRSIRFRPLPNRLRFFKPRLTPHGRGFITLRHLRNILSPVLPPVPRKK